MKIKVPLSVSNIKSWEELRKYVSITLDQIVTAINGQIEFIDNCATSQVSVVIPASGEIGVPHTLGRVPNGYLVAKSSAGIIVFDGTTANTSSNLYVQGTGAANVVLLVY